MLLRGKIPVLPELGPYREYYDGLYYSNYSVDTEALSGASPYRLNSGYSTQISYNRWVGEPYFGNIKRKA